MSESPTSGAAHFFFFFLKKTASKSSTLYELKHQFLTANWYGISCWGAKNILEVVVLVTQFYDCTKKLGGIQLLPQLLKELRFT